MVLSILSGSRIESEPNRSNHLGLTLVQLLAVHSTTLIVRDLDAYDGSTILDIKPYTPSKMPLAS
jgi:tRNA (Thr-GGU) A37 N-methylase